MHDRREVVPRGRPDPRSAKVPWRGCTPPGRHATIPAERKHARERAVSMPVMPGAEPFFHSGGSTAVLLCHGFTGNPSSMRPWADYLAAAGLTVSLPRLPGHGTTWQEMAGTRWEDWYAEVDRAYEELRGRTGEIFVMGLSMGATLALDGVLARLAPVFGHLVPSIKGIGSDIKKDGARELAYGRIPGPAAASLGRLWKVTRQRLGEVTQPVLVYRSADDHVVGPASLEILRAALPAGQLTVRELGNSYHVATLDNEAGEIFAGSLEFVRAHGRAGRSEGVNSSEDRKSTRLNSSHVKISYAVFCLKKKKT